MIIGNITSDNFNLDGNGKDIQIEVYEQLIEHLQQENKQLKSNWNKLKKWVNKHYDYYMNNEDYIGGRLCFTDMKNKMHELEGSDSNVKD